MLGKTPAHPTEDELFKLYNTRLPDRHSHIAAHLAACPECARRLERRLFNSALGALSARPEGAFDYPGMLRSTLAAAARRAARVTLKKRLATWSATRSALAGGIVHWRPASKGGRGSGHIELVNTFTGSSPWQIRAVETRAHHSSVTTSGEPAGPQAVVHLTGPRELAVNVFHWPAGATAPLVLLAREVRTSPPVVKQTRKDPRLRAQSARFGNLLPGRYLLGLEPVPARADPP